MNLSLIININLNIENWANIIYYFKFIW
jgi:hypothetical protein